MPVAKKKKNVVTMLNTTFDELFTIEYNPLFSPKTFEVSTMFTIPKFVSQSEVMSTVLISCNNLYHG